MSNCVFLPEYGQFEQPGSLINHAGIKVCVGRSGVDGKLRVGRCVKMRRLGSWPAAAVACPPSNVMRASIIERLQQPHPTPIESPADCVDDDCAPWFAGAQDHGLKIASLIPAAVRV